MPLVSRRFRDISLLPSNWGAMKVSHAAFKRKGPLQRALGQLGFHGRYPSSNRTWREFLRWIERLGPRLGALVFGDFGLAPVRM